MCCLFLWDIGSDRAGLRSIRRARRGLQTPRLCIQKSPATHEQIRQRRGHLQSVQISRKAPVADLLEPKHPLDDSHRMLDFGAHLGLGPVLAFLDLIDAPVAAVPTVGEV